MTPHSSSRYCRSCRVARAAQAELTRRKDAASAEAEALQPRVEAMLERLRVRGPRGPEGRGALKAEGARLAVSC